MDHLDVAAGFLNSADHDANPAQIAMAYIQLWHAERIRKFEQAHEEWQRKQRENAPPPPPMSLPGYGGF